MPSVDGLPNGYKQNPKQPQIRFIRKNGRIIPIVNRKKVSAASDNLEGRLGEMKGEVSGASSEGKSFKQGIDGSTSYSKGFSNYPEFYRQLKFRNKNDFFKAFVGKGKKADDLVGQAHEDLSNGYESALSGRVPPDLNYKTETRQVFNNNGIVFRKIKGRVVPIKSSKKAKKNDYNNDVPF